MAETKVIMPQMGESIFEGTLTRWLKKPGDTVKRDEPLFEISTDKIDSEIPSPASGTLQKILVQEGQTVEINTVVGIIGDGTRCYVRNRRACARSVKAAAPSTPPAAPVRRSNCGGRTTNPRQDTSPLSFAGWRASTGSTWRTCRQRHGRQRPHHQERHSSLHRTTRHGAGGRRGTGNVERVPMSAMRKSISEHMVMSLRTSAHVTTFFEVDCSSIMAAREKLKAEFEAAAQS